MATNASLETQLNNLEDLRLPELQACFKQVVGKATRAPNRKFLIRKIREAAAAHESPEDPAAPPKAPPATTPAEGPTAGQPKARNATKAPTKNKGHGSAPPRKPETKIGIRRFRSCAGDEGDAFSCILCLNEQPVATVRYAGTGGEYLYDFTMSDGTLGGGPNDSLFREYVASLPEEPWDPQDPTSRLCKRTEDEVVAFAIGTAQRMAARKASRREKGRKRVKKAPTRVVPPQPTPEPEPEATAETAPDRPDLKALSVNDDVGQFGGFYRYFWHGIYQGLGPSWVSS